MSRVLVAADTALLLEAADLEESMRLLPRLREAALPGVTELVPAARTVLVRFDPRVVDAEALAERLLAVEPATERTAAGTVVTIPVRYDGADLDEVAGLLGVSVEEVVARHQAATWSVAFTGYAPGFGYLVGDDPLFQVPRRPSPRTRIPAGSVGLAGEFSGVYPRESPGGWQLIGRTDAAMWDLARDEPALLSPGATVRFERVERELVELTPVGTGAGTARTEPAPGASATEPTGPAAEPAGQPAEPASSAAEPAGPPPDPAESAPDPTASVLHPATSALEVVRPGLQLLVQDLGRPAMAAEGVSASGVADRTAMREANHAVGNAIGTAVLELAGGGAVLRARGPAVVALTGADAPSSLRGAAGTATVAAGVPVALDDGDELHVGGVRRGLRVVLAVRGGIALPPVLGSLATDTLAGLGPAPLTAGDTLPLLGLAAATRAVDPVPAPRPPLPASGEEVTLRIVLGPRQDWFTADALTRLTTQAWAVTPRSDRVGVRLAGEPLERARDGELPSEGAVTGAIQVPPDGQPVLFLTDHPLTGGYPVVGAVVDADLDLAGQLPPGALLRFRTRDQTENQEEQP